MNLPNKLTLSRFALTALFLGVLFSSMPWKETVALWLFAFAGFTDYLDGRIARERGLVTNFGILMDPLADKILVCSAFIGFVEHDWMPAWMAIVVVARELSITGLRLLAASKQVVLAAEGYGKHKTISQIVAILAVLILAGCKDWDVLGPVLSVPVMGRPWMAWVAELSKWVAVVLTVVSGGLYLWHNRRLYLDDL